MTITYKNVVEHLTRIYPTLSKQLKKSAAYILENPGDVATLSMRQVAAKANVPPPTMNRLAKSIGFATYNAFRDIYRGDFYDITSDYPQKAEQLQASAGSSDFDQTLLNFRQAGLSNLNNLFDSLDEKKMTEIIDSLIGARNVIVVGMHASHSMANYFHYVAAMCFRNWHLITRHNGEIADRIVDLNSEDVVVAISLDPCAADTILVAKQAKKIGARVIGITDSRTTPLASCSTNLFITPVQNPHFFGSYVATAALLEVIIGMLVAHSGKEIIDNIDNLERVRHEMGEYWQTELHNKPGIL